MKKESQESEVSSDGEESKSVSSEKEPSAELRVTKRTWVIAVVILVALIVIFFAFKQTDSSPPVTGKTVADVPEKVKQLEQDKNKTSSQNTSLSVEEKSVEKVLHVPQFVSAWKSSFPATVAVAIDVDHDGKNDLLLGSADKQAVLFKNKGNLVFEQDLSFSVGLVETLDCVDVDKDAYPECVAGAKNQQQFTLENDKGVLTKINNINMHTETDVRAMRWADFNNDDTFDIAVGKYKQQNQLFISRNGKLVMSEQFGIGDVTDMQWADVDQNGFVDLLVTTYGGKGMLYFNTGKTVGSPFEKPVPVGEDGMTTRAVSVVDVNNDAYPDFVFANYEKKSKLFVNQKNRTFTELAPFDAELIQTVATGDVNNDGNEDVVLGNYNGETYMYLNRGDMTFEKQFLTDGLVRSLLITDFTNDGKKDIFVGKVKGESEVFRNTQIE